MTSHRPMLATNAVVLVLSGFILAACSADVSDSSDDTEGAPIAQTVAELRRDGGSCSIDKVKIAEGTLNPANACESCQPRVSRTSWTIVADGTACNDGDACTQTDRCQAGACVGANPVVCTASDVCHVAGTCNRSTGACSEVVAPTGAACYTSSGTRGTCDDAASCVALPNVVISGLSVALANAATCQYRWTATVTNNTPLAYVSATAQAYQDTSGAGGTRVDLLALSSRSVSLSFNYDRPRSSLYLSVFHDGQVLATSDTVPLPGRPAPETALGLVDFQATETFYSVAVTNRTSLGYPGADMTLQAYSGTTPAGPWTPAGGRTLGCVPPAGKVVQDNTKPSDHGFVKVVVTQSAPSTIVFEQVFSAPVALTSLPVW